MKKTISLILLGFILLLCFIACEYEPKGGFYRVVNPETELPDLIVEANFDADTLILEWGTRLEFAYEITNKKILSVKAYIDEFELNISHNSFDVRVTLSEGLECFKGPGIYNFKLDIFTNSETGSIADLAGAEGFLYRQEYVLVMIDSMISPQIQSINYVDGAIEIEWNPFRGVDFESYTLKKFKSYEGYGGGLVSLPAISDEKVLAAVDDSYVGEEVGFFITTKIDNKQYHSDTVYLPKDIPQVQLEKLNDGATFKYTWNKSKYYRNFAGYQLSQFETRHGYPPLYDEITILTNINDTSYIYENVKIGQKIDFLLTMVSPIAHQLYENYMTRIDIFSTNHVDQIGEDFPVYYRMITPVGPKQYFKDYDFIIRSYDPENDIHDSIFYLGYDYFNFNVSANSKYLLANTSMNTCDLFDLQNQTRQIFPYEEITEGLSSVIGVGISDNGIGAMSGSSKIFVYDFVNEELIASKDASNTPEILIMSPDGEYVIGTQNYFFWVWKIENGTLTLILSSSPWGYDFKYIDFRTGDPQQILIFSDGILNFVDRADATILQSVPMPFKWAQNIDHNAGHILGISEDNMLRVCNVNSGAVIWEWPRVEDAWGFYLFNGKISSTDGYIFDIDE